MSAFDHFRRVTEHSHLDDFILDVEISQWFDDEISHLLELMKINTGIQSKNDINWILTICYKLFEWQDFIL